MPFSEGLVFPFLLGMSGARNQAQPMKFSCVHRLGSRIRIAIVGVAVCLPALASAHPGHYHPDETDEFDFLRATVFHSHGALDFVMATVAIVSVITAVFPTKPAVRIGALAAGIASLSALALL